MGAHGHVTDRRGPLSRGGLARDVAVGDYLCSEHDLYRVEHLAGSRVVIEDCRVGQLIDVSVAELRRLRPVRKSTS